MKNCAHGQRLSYAGEFTHMHIPTMFVMIIFGSVTLALSVLVASERHAGDGLREWGMSLCLYALGHVLLALRNIIPDALSIVGANTLLSVAYSVFYYAVHVFLGKRANRRWLEWVPPIAMAAAITMVIYNPTHRVIVANSILLSQGLLVLDVLLGHRFDFPVRGRNLMVFGIVLAIGVLTWKVAAAVITPDEVTNLFLSSTVQVGVSLISFTAIITVSNGFALMAKERSDTFLRTAAMLDKLTGCWNRVRIEEIARQEIARLQRYGYPAAALMLDLDNFKLVNDEYGHMAGDEALRFFGRLLRDTIRSTDVAGRWGGEEFIIIMPSSAIFDAARMAERIRAQMEQHRFSFCHGITVSIGVAACRATDTMEEWISRADMALYRAKNAGRNQVKVENLDGDLENFMRGSVRSARLQWNKNYECGHAAIDQQHRELFGVLNNLLQLGEEGADRTAMREEITKLLNNTVLHFQYEEQILFQNGYSEAMPHAEAHRQLLQRAEQLITQYEDNQVNLAALLHFMVYELTAQHIMIDDRRFGVIGDSSAPASSARPSVPV